MAQTPQGDKRFTLRGQVVDGVTGKPLTNVELDLDDAQWQPAAEPVAPDAQGRFAFKGLAAGEYILSAARLDFGTIFFDELPDPGYVQTIHIKPDQPEKTVLFRVIPRGVVTGIVRDELSEPLERVNVTLYRAVWEDGHITFQSGLQSTTDDRGRFRIGNVPPGGYFVCTLASGNPSDAAAPAAGPVDFAAQAEPRYYSPACSPDVSAEARPLSVLPGRQHEVQLTMRAGTAAVLKGRVLNLPQGVGIGVQLFREGGFSTQQMMATGTGMDGKFTFRGVPPGRYRLEAEFIQPPGTGTRLVARVPVDLRGGNLGDIEVPLEQPELLDVAVHGAPDGVPPERMMVGLRSSWGLSWAERDGQGPMRFTSLLSGEYWLVTRTTRNTCVQSARLGEQDALRGPVTVKAAGRLDVNLSTECGGIQARAVSDGEPVPDAKVLLLVSGSPKDPGNLLQDFADDQGESWFDGLRPGRYLVWAWSVDAAGAFVGPASLADVAKMATEVVVAAGEPVKVDVPVMRPEDRR